MAAAVVIGMAAPARQDAVPEASPCQSCGACCAYSREWPRFTTEDDADLDRIPATYVAEDRRGMRCDGDRCSALEGEIGVSTACAIYVDRPDVCHACEAGDEACAMARRRHGLAPLPAG